MKARVEELEEKLKNLIEEGQRDPTEEEFKEEEWLNYKIEDLERKIDEETRRQQRAKKPGPNPFEGFIPIPKNEDKN